MNTIKKASRKCLIALFFLLMLMPATTVRTYAENVSNWTNGDIELSYTFQEGEKGETAVLTGASYTTPVSASWSANASDGTITGSVTPGCDTKKTFLGTAKYPRGGAQTVLTITNKSGTLSTLSFNYTGSPSITGAASNSNNTVTATLAHDASVTVTLTTNNSPDWSGFTSQSSYTVSTVISNLTLEAVQIDPKVTLMPTAIGGSYTVLADGQALTVGQTHSKSANTEYTFTATPSANYQVEGWYFNGEKYPDTSEIITGIHFATDTTVEPKFILDPLYSIATKNPALEGDISEYITVDSIYYHNPTGSNHTMHGDIGKNNNYGPPVYFPDPAWSVGPNNTIVSSASGVAESDVQTEGGRCNAASYIYSDIIRIQCLQSCTISFTSDITATSMDELDGNASGVYFYYWVTDKANATSAEIIANGTKLIDGHYASEGSADSGEISLNEGEYIYLYSNASTMKSETQYVVIGYAYITDNYTYTSTLSDFVVAPPSEDGTVEIGNYDNTGTLLQSGSVVINGANTALTSTNFTDTVQQGTTYTLRAGTAPAGYMFFGWDIDGTRNYTSTEVTVTLAAESMNIKALYVPAMIIDAAGANGYGNATYSFGGNQYETGDNPYFVARSANCDAFYTDLNTAFATEDVIVLLAGHTFNGNLTVPSGKTLVIPGKLADKGISGDDAIQTTEPLGVTNYCAVTVNGNWTVDGKLLVNGEQTGNSAYNGRPGGGIGCLVLDNDSLITLNGTLYAYGHVRGGNIHASATAMVHELAEFTDRRGIISMKNVFDNTESYEILPFNCFALESVESDVTYNVGAKLIGHFSMLFEGNTENTFGSSTIIGPTEGFLLLESGTITKRYDFDTNRTVWCIDENAKVSTGNIRCTFHYKYLDQSQEVTINTNEIYFPFNQGHAIEVNGNLTFTSNYKFLPGSSLTVTQTGHCTVANGANIIMYRTNDYDNRAASDIDNYIGYSVFEYPVWSLAYPLGGYTPFKGISELESATLTVNGLMTVNGGLYVTNDLISETDQGIADFVIRQTDGTTTTVNRLEHNKSIFTKYPNGYNHLKGTGIIDMTNASISKTHVYEVMGMAGSNNLAYDEVKILSIAGLVPTAASDVPGEYINFAAGKKYGGVIKSNGLNVWCSHVFTNSETCDNGCGAIAPAAWINGSTITYYGTLADAVNSYNSSGYIQMNADTTESVVGDANAKKDIYLDLNGQVVTVTNFYAKNLYGMDTATNAFGQVAANQTYSYGSLNGTVDGTVLDHHQYRGTGKYYATSFDGKSSYSFHRFDLGVKNYSFYGSGNTGVLEFNMEVKGDALALAEIRKTGVNLSNGNNWYTTKETAYTGHISGLTTTADFTTPITVRAAIMMNDTASANTNGTVILGNRTGYFADGISFKTAMLAVMNDQNKAQFEQFATSNGFQLQ